MYNLYADAQVLLFIVYLPVTCIYRYRIFIRVIEIIDFVNTICIYWFTCVTCTVEYKGHLTASWQLIYLKYYKIILKNSLKFIIKILLKIQYNYFKGVFIMNFNQE